MAAYDKSQSVVWNPAYPAYNLDPAAAAFAPQELSLPPRMVHEAVLTVPSRGEASEQGAVMPIAPAQHLRDLQFMPREQGLETAPPAQGLGMTGVALLALSDDGPDGMELPMLAQEMAAAEELRRDVPDSHNPTFLGT